MNAPGDATHFPGRIGLGTWGRALPPRNVSQEIAAVKHALDIGYRLRDTAQMYADGGAERIVGSAHRGESTCGGPAPEPRAARADRPGVSAAELEAAAGDGLGA